jgi:hypothetical protein
MCCMLLCTRVTELEGCNGENGKPLLLAVNGTVFDVLSHPSGRDFYGPGCGYNVLTGRCVVCDRGSRRRAPPLPGSRPARA